MEPDRSEEKRGEIEKTTERHVTHSWLNWLPFALFPVMMGWLFLDVWLVRLGLAWRGLSWQEGRGYSLYCWLVFPLAFVGIILIAGLFGTWHEPWRKRKLAVMTKTMAQPLSAKMGLFIAFYMGVFVGLSHEIGVLPPRFQPLVLGLCWAPAPIICIALGWVPRPKKPIWQWLWEESPVASLGIVIWVCYALAVAAGAPRPWGPALDRYGGFVASAVPVGVVWLIAALVSELYSRAQLRHLQRLVRDVPPEGHDGTH